MNNFRCLSNMEVVSIRPDGEEAEVMLRYGDVHSGVKHVELYGLDGKSWCDITMDDNTTYLLIEQGDVQFNGECHFIQRDDHVVNEAIETLVDDALDLDGDGEEEDLLTDPEPFSYPEEALTDMGQEEEMETAQEDDALTDGKQEYVEEEPEEKGSAEAEADEAEGEY